MSGDIIFFIMIIVKIEKEGQKRTTFSEKSGHGTVNRLS